MGTAALPAGEVFQAQGQESVCNYDEGGAPIIGSEIHWSATLRSEWSHVPVGTHLQGNVAYTTTVTHVGGQTAYWVTASTVGILRLESVRGGYTVFLYGNPGATRQQLTSVMKALLSRL